MDTESDLTTADRDFLIAIIAQLQATVLEQQRVIERLERRIAELEGRAKPDGPPRMPGLKASSGRQPPAQQQPRKQRRHGFARPRMTPTHRVEHVVESCPDCGAHLSGGWTQRTREVIELPVVPVQVTEHVFIARTCPVCRRRRVPTAQLDGVALGRQRLGVNLLSRIATLREEGRLPIRSIQWYLRTVHQLRLSVGAIVSAIHQTAQQAQPAVAANGGPHPRQPSGPRRRNRLASEWEQRLRVRALDQSLSALPPSATSCGGVGARRWWTKRWASHSPEYWSAISTLPTTITMAPSNGAGRTCCGTSTTCVALYPKAALAGPAGRRQSIDSTRKPKPSLILRHDDGAPLNWPGSGSCWPSAALSCLTRRLSRANCAGASSATSSACPVLDTELFVFVAEPDVPSDNNPAERSLRHLVISRKISGGTRSERGTESKMTLASVFGTWRARGLNPLAACRQLLTSPLL